MTTLGENRDEFLYVDKVLFRKELICLMSRYDYVDPILLFLNWFMSLMKKR